MITPTLNPVESSRTSAAAGSAVSWAAILAGATAAAALSLVLLVLGTGLGLAAASPWGGVSGAAITWTTIIWIGATAIASAGLGGYITGRLRCGWPSVHVDEVYFRDTAHGFLAWALATLLAASVLTSVTGTLLHGAAIVGEVAAAAAGPALVEQGSSTQPKQSDTDGLASPYTIDALFRLSANVPSIAPPRTVSPTGVANMRIAEEARNEAAHIFANSKSTGALPADDLQYIGQLVAQQTGMTQQEAEGRVSATYNAALEKMQAAAEKAKAAADQARKNAAYASLWLFVSLLLGAFTASLLATLGGRRRDMH